MYLQSDKITVSLDGLVFRTYKWVGDFQFILDDTAIEGWYDGVSTRRDGSMRPNQWGDFSDVGRKGSRVVTITGTAIASSSQGLQQARDKFTGLLQNGTYKQMTVATEDEVRYLTVSLEGSPSWVRMSDTVAVWKLDLYAPDPRIYGAEQTVTLGDNTVSGGLDYPLVYPISYGTGSTAPQVYITNNGNVDSWPIFRVEGNFNAGFHIKNNKGSIVTYLGMVTMTSPVTIDMAAGTAMQNGQDRSVNLSRRDWFSVGPKSSIRPTFEPIQDGPGWCDIMYRDTWI